MRYALLDADGVVLDLIEADAEFAGALVDQVADETVDTGPHLDAVHRALPLEDADSEVSLGWRRARNGRWSAPEPTEEQRAAEAAAAAEQEGRTAADAFVTAALERVRDGGELSPSERDRLDLIRLARG